MIECRECRTMSRRRLLQQAGRSVAALALADPLLNDVAGTFAQSAGGTGNLLVLCQLNGGLDVLSFLAPYRNSVYLSKRPVLALREADVTPLHDNAEYGISKLFPFFSSLYAQGQLGIVQQVAYPDGNGSHFESQEIYEYGVRNLGNGEGTAAPWYERLRRTYFDAPFGVLDTQTIGDPQRYGYPDSTYRQGAQSTFGRMAASKTGKTPQAQAVLDQYKRIDGLGKELRSRTRTFTSTGRARGDFYRAAQLASAGLGTRVIKLSYGGFDTHGSQNTANATLFPRLNDEFSQFVADLKAVGQWDRTCICFYTEFGRRNEENGSPGTDHGYGSHIILAGPRVRGGLHGQAVTTSDLNESSLPYYVDFRAVFGEVIRQWLGFNPAPVFQIGGETYDSQIGSSLFT